MQLYEKAILNEAIQHSRNKVWMKKKLERALDMLFPCFRPFFEGAQLDLINKRVLGTVTTERGTACLQWTPTDLEGVPYSVGTVQFIWLKQKGE